MGSKMESCISIDGSGKPHIDTQTLSESKIHDKTLWEIGHLFTIVANAANADVFISAPVIWLGVEFHFTVSINVGGNCFVYLYRDPIVSNNGTALPSINRYQDLTPVEAAASGMFHTPTVTNVGALLSESLAPGGSGIATVGGSSRDAQWIIDGNHTFLIRVTNSSGGNIPISITMIGHT